MPVSTIRQSLIFASCFSCSDFHWDALWAGRFWLSGVRGALTIRIVFAPGRKWSSDLAVIEESYMLPNHSGFGAIKEEHFLEGNRLLSSLERMNSNYLRKESRKHCRRLLGVFFITILSIVATRSLVWQVLSFFYPKKVIGNHDYSAF